MKVYWDEFIEPLIKCLKPTTLIEIGVDKGDNTKNILDYCIKNKCKLISIDPFPDSSLKELEYKYEKEFSLIKDLSLNILKDIDEAQVVFIDGDHNWYTVFNELKVLEEKTTTNPFPLIFLHDIEWPYDKRDLYYDPSNVPSEYVNPYAKKGIDLYSKKLSDDSGINSGFFNAIQSDTANNGVLTAVDDFLNQTDFDLRLIKIPGFHGLGIMYDETTYNENNDFKLFIDKIVTELDNFGGFLHKLSYSNYEYLNRISQNESLISKVNRDIQNLNESINMKDNTIEEQKSLILERDSLINEQKSLILERDSLINEQKSIIQDKERVIKSNELKNSTEIKRLSQEINKLSQNIKKTIESNTVESKKLNLKIVDLKSNLLEIQYYQNSKRSFTQKLYSKIPSLYILLNIKNTGLKNSILNLKGYKSIKNKDLLDIGYYLNKNKDIRISGIDPILHYIYHGFKEKRDPSPTFDAEYYLSRYGDVKASGMNPLIHYSLYGINEGKKTKADKKISVVVTSYNHEKYIRKCIDSILMQKGVLFEVIIGDDCSTDDTRRILEEYKKQHPKIIKLLPLTKNMGVTKNLERCLKAVTGNYVAICEGDDYWTDPHKLLKQSNFLDKRQDCAMCFNSILMYYENNMEKNYIFQEKLTKNTYKTRELILDNFIGNFSCCMYRSSVIRKLPDALYDLYTVDWIFNITCSLQGNIGFLKEQMTVYRKHNTAQWSSKNEIDQNFELSKHIDFYNKFLSYKFDLEFEKYKKRCDKYIRMNGLRSGLQDVIILDDAFPHPLSAFRLQEYNSYLDYFGDVKVFCKSEIAFPCLNETRPLKTIIQNYEKKYPQFKGKVAGYDPEIILEAKMIYTIFLANIYYFIDAIEKYKIPFAFTLYPGGGFELNDPASDKKLKRVFSSPYFRKVIVTQKITKDYLIDNKFLKPDMIEEIFGVVTPLILLEKEYEIKNHFGKNKSTLDICFVAYKYTENGIDKGYDVFIDVAHKLAEKYDNINFHVVGGFDENEIDITKIKDRIKFYGPRSSEWFDEFYKDKDLILSPNIPYKMFDGHFDGFPTGCCTEAGLHKVAIFCTDELNMNTSKFKENEEIVIIPHNSQKIVEIIEKYYYNPEKLQEIGEKGYLKIKEIYNYENQILPRINVIKKVIDNEKYIKLLKEINHNIVTEKNKYVNSENTLKNLEEQKIELLSKLTQDSLQQTDSLKLNIGCGKVKFPGWVNIDIEPDADLVADVKKGLPIADNSVDYIYNEHFIEHLNFEDGKNAVKEFHRILKPGAVLRLAAPDLDYIVDKYSNDWKNQDWLSWPGFEYIKTKGQMLNISMREWGHEFVYNAEDLKNLLVSAGFKKITKCELYKSQHSELSNRETRKDSKLIFEAEK